MLRSIIFINKYFIKSMQKIFHLHLSGRMSVYIFYYLTRRIHLLINKKILRSYFSWRNINTKKISIFYNGHHIHSFGAIFIFRTKKREREIPIVYISCGMSIFKIMLCCIFWWVVYDWTERKIMQRLLLLFNESYF